LVGYEGNNSPGDGEKRINFKKWPRFIFTRRIYDWQIDKLTGFADL